MMRFYCVHRVLFVVALMLSGCDGFQSETMARDIEKEFKIAPEYFGLITTSVHSIADSAGMEVIEPSYEIVLSDGPKYIIALREMGDQKGDGFYCFVIDNVQDSETLLLQGYSGACRAPGLYGKVLDELLDSLHQLEQKSDEKEKAWPE